MQKQLLIKYIGEDWYPILFPVFETHWEVIKALIKSESRPITPELQSIFKPFELCRTEKLKCIILSNEPNNGLVYNLRIADGLALSSKNSMNQPPKELRIVQQAWADLDNNVPWKTDTDLSYLADQGVLLLNSSFTTLVGKEYAHEDIWRVFTQDILRAITSNFNLPVIILGEKAKEFEDYMNPLTSTIFYAPHPLSANLEEDCTVWEHNDIFKKVNEFINSTNGFQHEIQWLNKEVKPLAFTL
jgi:uracil-DNA glycosylase